MENLKKFYEKVERMEKILYDNGQKGLISNVHQLNESVPTLSKNVEVLSTAVSGLTKFRDETIGGIRAKERMKVHSQWIIGLLVTAVLGLITFIAL